VRSSTREKKEGELAASMSDPTKNPHDSEGWAAIARWDSEEIQKLETVAAAVEQYERLSSAPFMVYRQRDPASGKLYDHFTVVNEDESPRRGHTAPTLLEAIDDAFPAIDDAFPQNTEVARESGE